MGDGDGESVGLGLGFVAPPEGIPTSPCPVAGEAASTGKLFGSAVSGEADGVACVAG